MAYFMISVDDPQTNLEFAQSLNSNFPLLSNPTREVAEAYGVVTRGGGFPSRWTFIIGGDGRILKIDKRVSPSTAGQDLVAHMQELGLTN